MLAGRPPAELPPALLEEPCGEALFGILVEGLADRFEPALCDVYARLFSQAVAQVAEGVDAGALEARYQRVRRPRPVAGEPRRVFVLSRVTLGADVAVTSVLLAAAKRRFPHAEIVFVGPRKNYELFAGDPRVHHADVAYRARRPAPAAGRLGGSQAAPGRAGRLVIDPDSRLTQLGLLPVCAEERYHLFDSRAYGGDAGPQPARTGRGLGAGNLRRRRSQAVRQPWGPGAAPARRAHRRQPGGGREPRQAHSRSVRRGAAAPAGRDAARPLWIDKGAGGEEAERVERAVERSGVKRHVLGRLLRRLRRHHRRQPVVRGLRLRRPARGRRRGVPLISIFAGFPAPRMFDRWRPAGERAT